MAASSKSKGPGCVLLLLVLLLGVAGGSAWFIHTLLTGDELAAGEAPSGAAAGQTRTSSSGVESFAIGPDGSPIAAPPPAEPNETVALEASFPTELETRASPEPDAAWDDPDGQPKNVLLAPGVMAPLPPAAREDAVVRPAFVDDVAAFLTRCYWPKSTHPAANFSGVTTVSLQWANLRYGAELQERGGDPGAARNAVLQYVLNPAVIDRLYVLYADEFVRALGNKADQRVVEERGGKRYLSSTEKKEMFAIYASYAERVAKALERYATDSSIRAKVEEYAQASHVVQEANKAYIESMLAHEDASGAGGRSQITAARLRMDKDAAAYQKSIRERETKRDALVAAMNPGGPLRGGDDVLTYTAFWAYRRGPDNSPGLRACAKALADMSAKLRASARRF